MTDQQVPVATYNWGPCVIKIKARDNFIKMLLDEAKKSKISYEHKLAGQLNKEMGYTQESKDIIAPELAKYLGAYDQMYQKYQNKPYENPPKYAISALWINYQRQYDFNPPHDHDGALSFVVYLDIPEELIEENKNYKGRSCGPGGIQFVYGDGGRDYITYMSEVPKTGEMFIFPASLKHWVSPFRSDVTRISVSGNIHNTVPIHTLPKNTKIKAS
jgi:hypothetical protein